MGIVCYLPKNHVRASSRAARDVKASEVRPAARARSVDKTADHRSAGILSRCHHLETVVARLDTSKAIASLEGHKSITSRKERKSAIPMVLGQLVLKRKDILALDGKKSLGHDVRMADSDEDIQFKQEFTARVKSARVATGRKQWEVAELLQVPQDYYKHWESGRLMPHRYIGRFCTICRVDPGWLLSGQGPKALREPHLVETEPQPAKVKPKRQKRSKAA